MPTYRIKGTMRQSGVKTTRTYQEPTEQDAINAALVDGLDVDKVTNTYRRNYVIFCGVAPTLLILFLITIIPWPSFGAPTLPTIQQLFNDFEMRVDTQYYGKEIFGLKLCENNIDNFHIIDKSKSVTAITLWTDGSDNNSPAHAIESFHAFFQYDQSNKSYKLSYVDRYWQSVRIIQKYTDIPDDYFEPRTNIHSAFWLAEWSDYKSSQTCKIIREDWGREILITRDLYNEYIIKHHITIDLHQNITYITIVQTHEWDPHWLSEEDQTHASR